MSSSLRLFPLALVACSPHHPAAVDAAASSDAPADVTLDASTPDAPAPPCTFDNPLPPPSSVLWPPQLSASGMDTLARHGHDDGHGPVGFCAGARVTGQPFYRLIAAAFEVDYDVNSSGASGDFAIHPTFWRDPATFDGLAESGGRVAVYVDIVDAAGQVLNVTTNPEITLTREIDGGPTDQFPLTSKPADEFQTNVPMVGGGQRYAFSVTGASDKVINMRLPNNHHLTYELVFRRELP